MTGHTSRLPILFAALFILSSVSKDIVAGGRHGHPPLGDAIPRKCPPTPATDGGGSLCCTGSGDPIKVIGGFNGGGDLTFDGLSFSTIFDDQLDVSIPVKHGLSLDVRRMYSSDYVTRRNHKGFGPLGYDEGTSGNRNTNWFLAPYDMQITRRPHWDSDNLDDKQLVFVNETGGWIFFDQDSWYQVDDDDQLYAPNTDYENRWGMNTWVTRYYPELNTDSLGRQTGSDMTLFLLHGADPDGEIGVANIIGYVIRYASGLQYHFEPAAAGWSGFSGQTFAEGRLRFIDANWRNNVEYDSDYSNGHVDDYIEIEYRDSYCKANNGSPIAGIKTIDRVLAPPSDGRSLVFNHPTYSSSIYTHVTSVDLAAGDGLTTHTNLVQYSYIDSGSNVQIGRLEKVAVGKGNGGNPVHGKKYIYGHVSGFSTGNFTFDQDPNNDRRSSIAQIRRFVGSTDYPLVTNDQRFTSGSSDINRYTTQYVIDPDDNTTWREAFTITNLGSASTPKRLTWADGQVYAGNEHTRYTDSSPESYSDYHLNQWGDYTHLSYGNVVNPPPDIREDFYAGPYWTSKTRLLNKRYLSIPDNEFTSASMITLVDYDYLDDSGPASNTTGIDYPTTITQYAGFIQDGAELVEDPSKKLVTKMAYSDSDFPAAASVVDQPDGSRIVVDYDTQGKALAVVSYQHNTQTNSYDVLSTTTTSYVEPTTASLNHAANNGLVEQVVYEPVEGPVRIATYIYSDPDVNGVGAGNLVAVTMDDDATTYTYNYFGDVRTIETEQGVSTTVYSDEFATTHSLYFVPPRAVESEDAAGNIVEYTYDALDRVSVVTAAPGIGGLEQETTYEYDTHDNVISVTAPDDGETTYRFSIYGKLVGMTDPEGTVTHYQRDSFGRVVSEHVEKSATVLYNIDYLYGDSTSLCAPCGGGGGGSSQVTERIISNGDRTTTETITFEYDLLGRMISMHDSESDRTVEFTFDFTEHDGTRLTEIDHGAEWFGNNTLRYEYDEHNRMKRDVGPFGRYTEFNYDASGRITGIKDPFGFISKIEYDDANKGRLDEMTHSTLGEAIFNYNADDTLQGYRYATFIGGTDYAYDEFGRLTGFEAFRWNGMAGESVASQAWNYDDLGRKSNIVLAVESDPTLEAIQLAYDAASRLTNETLATSGADAWTVDYEYDEAGNRTRYAPDAEDFEITYEAGNREDEVDSTVMQEYDFKGNVITRTSLEDSVEYEYTWDAYDRMTAANHGDPAQGSAYLYDGLGRMAGRMAIDWGEPQYRLDMPTWLGLNKLCEERFLGYSGEGFFDVLRPDDEMTTDAMDVGWNSFIGLDTIEYVTDTDRGKVAHLAGDNWIGGGIFLIGDLKDEESNGNADPFDYPGGRVTMWFKNNNIGEPVTFYFATNNYADEDEQYLIFVTDNGTDSGAPGEELLFFLGDEYNDGEWHYMEFDLATRVHQFGDAEDFLCVNGLMGFSDALDVEVDDLVFGAGLLGKSYQLIPGALIGGYIGAQSGMEGSHYDDFYTSATATIPAYGKYYYNYNDLGTVTSTVDDTGAVIGVYVPDFFGNYRYVDGDRPDRLGLQSNFEDPTAGLNYGKARWYDRERGSWTGRDPESLIERYDFCSGSPSIFIDPDGAYPFDARGKDLNWPECTPENIQQQPCDDCTPQFARDRLKDNQDKVKDINNLLNNRTPSRNYLFKAPGSAGQTKPSSGVTTDGFPARSYFDPSVPRCQAFCICYHEAVHRVQFALGGRPSGMQYLHRELPAFEASVDCWRAVLFLTLTAR